MPLTCLVISVEDGDAANCVRVGQIDLPERDVLVSMVPGVGCVDSRTVSAFVRRIAISVDSTIGIQSGITTGSEVGVHSALDGLLPQRRVF